ncbi:Zinc finger CCCH-type [Penicillium subrubescens]|uniref:Zinc finger CCCH-type n=1 Tax=Penicillium subrubescens TaxID=1316194 RepID=UPI002544D3E6|nr:Zinc finger CCCH-type [Penicillium subrubescens]KAJ5873656.1 Zinc finger CCCH-type [Penicillium subrubescens]
MRENSEIASLTNHLGIVSKENTKHHKSLQDVLEQFKRLLDDYSSLKSDYEEVKEGREKYKRQARGQDRNPFVLVLVDGDGYLFREHFIKAGAEGGIEAARELSDSVRELMDSTLGMQADQCLCASEARSLAPFISAFNRAQDLFDFVDAAERKEGSDFKIREMFRLFADSNQCRHIYFAGCHDSGFGSLLTPYRGRGDRITLIRAASFHGDFEELGLPIRELPSVFKSTPVASTKPIATANTKMASTITINGSNKPICRHYQRGICKYGSSCIKQHVMPGQILSAKPADESPKQLWSTPWSTPTIEGRSMEFLSNHLPPMSLKAKKYIAINKDNERLDTYCPCPSADVLDEFHRRAREHKICNSYHLSGECDDLSCHYDHSTVTEAMVDVLRYILRLHPCPRAGACRSIKCYMGHLCQKPNCIPVKRWPCRFNHRGHMLDLQVAQWVAPV